MEAIWIKNHHSGNGPGRPSFIGPAFTGSDLYKLVILTRPDWSATVIVYDR